MSNSVPDPEPSPQDLVEQLHIVAGQLRLAWRQPKTDETIKLIEDLGLHFRLLTDAYDAEVKREATRQP
jgi:hypothetical protein